jgi:protein-tyrosine phosphatase
MKSPNKRVAILFVCMGNICRSPAAHGAMEHLLGSRGLKDRVFVDSAGTIGYHEGSLPDPRMREAASRRGVALTHRARQVRHEDFARFDYILAMDGDNLRCLREMAAHTPPPDHCRVGLFLDHLPQAPLREVPDPYYGGPEGFDLVLDLVEQGCAALLDEIGTTHGWGR